MIYQLVTTIVGGVGYATAAAAAYFHLRRRAAWAPGVLRTAAGLALVAELGYLGFSVARHGLVGTFENNFDAILLLSTLIGLVGLGTHLSPTLRGLDGLLFLAAALVAFSELVVLGQPDAASTSRPWFVSHSLAFALSGTLFIAGGVAGVAYLLINWMLRRKRLGIIRSVPPLEALERFGRWMPILGFPLFTYGILTGLCGVSHRKDLAATAWYFDPTFLFSLGAWGVYAYLAFSFMWRPQVRGRRAATLATYGLGLVVVAFLTREFLSPLHQ